MDSVADRGDGIEPIGAWMLHYKEFLVLAGVLAPTTTIALIALWRHSHLWRWSLGVLATGAGICLYLPVRLALFKPPVSDGFAVFEIFAEFIVLGSVLGLWNLIISISIVVFIVEDWQRSIKRRMSDEG